MGHFFKKIVYLFEKLSSKPVIGGLELSDSIVRYVAIQKTGHLNYALKLPPGVVEEGRIKDVKQFGEILKQLHDLIKPGERSQMVPVIVSLPTSLVYTQSFNVPNLGEEKLKEAALLNLQALSPIAADQAYFSWQIISADPDRYELLGASIQKEIINQLRDEFNTAGFYPIIFEFPALALNHLIADTIKNLNRCVLVIWFSSEGVNLFVSRGEALYFDYFRSWQSIQIEGANSIPKSIFEAVITEEVQKVVNFISSRFKENLKDVLVIAPGFEAELKNMLETRFGLVVSPYAASAAHSDINPPSYVALGSALRGQFDRSRDNFIALGSDSASSSVDRDRILDFVRLWRNIFIAVLASFMIIFGFSAAYFVRQSNILRERLIQIKGTTEQTEELNRLQNSARLFNSLVSGIKTIRGGENKFQFLNEIHELAKQYRVTFDSLDFVSLESSVNLSAHAPEQNTILEFKKALSARKTFCRIELPIEKITVNPDSSVSFNLIFYVKC